MSSQLTIENTNDLLLKSINSIDDYAIFILDRFGHVQTWNHGARKIKGWLHGEVIGKHFSLFYTDEDIARHHPQRVLSIAADRGRFEEEAFRVRKNGERFWASVVVSAIKDEHGKVIAFNKVTKDLTSKKENEDKIQELQDTIRMRDEFISVASHELRTPVTRILLNLQLMKRTGEGLNERILKSLDVCESSTKQLIGLMDNLLDVTRLRLGKLEIKRTKTNITSVLLNVITKFKDQIRLAGNKVSLDHDGDIIGYWDQIRLEQLFTNLLSNAIKYTDGKDIRMELKKAEDNIFFFIEDDGPGIPSQMQKKVFERFERAVDSKRVSGLGLGLYVSKQIVEAHKGDITLSSERGLGARFIVRLPLKQEKR